jgi:hypothetical protein
VVKRKIKKFKGGGMDMGNPSNQKQSASMATSKTTGQTKANNQTTRPNPHTPSGTSKTSSQSVNFNKVSQPLSTNNLGTGQKTASTGFQLPSFSPLGLVKKIMTGVENQRRAKRAKGEYFLSSKKIMPINRDFYKVTGRPLDTKIGSADTQYMKDAGIIGFKPPKNLKDSGPNTELCPDGTYPPCKTPTTQIPSNTPAKNNFLSGFKSYDDGGEVIISSNVDKDLL